MKALKGKIKRWLSCYLVSFKGLYYNSSFVHLLTSMCGKIPDFAPFCSFVLPYKTLFIHEERPKNTSLYITVHSLITIMNLFIN